MPHRIESPGGSTQEALLAHYGSEIPSADLTGSTDVQVVEGEEAVIMDFSDVLDADEVFVATAAQFHGRLGIATVHGGTGGIMLVEWQLGPETQIDEILVNTPFFSGTPDAEDGIADIFTRQTDQTQHVIDAGLMYGYAPFNDGAGNTGGGDIDGFDLAYSFPDPWVFDANDELYWQHQWHVDGIGDVSVVAEVELVLFGDEREDVP